MQELLWIKNFYSLCISCLLYSNHSFIYCILLCFVKVLISMAFVFSYFFLVFSKPLYPKTPFPRSHYSQVRDSQPLSDAVEPEEDISQESNNTNDVTGFLESPTAHDRIARNAHPCISKVVREFEPCRNLWVDKVQCKRRHPTCSFVISTHGTPKCQPVYGFRDATFVTKCPSLPIDCQCAV